MSLPSRIGLVVAVLLLARAARVYWTCGAPLALLYTGLAVVVMLVALPPADDDEDAPECD